MKYTKNKPKTDQKLSEQLRKDAWNQIREPKGFVAAFMASLPFMLIGVCITYLVTIPFYNSDSFKHFFINGFSITVDLTSLPIGLVAMYLFIVAHKMLHAVAIPNFLKSEKTFWGLSLQGGFVFSTEVMSKRRFYLISILPLCVLSIILPLVLGFLGLLTPFMFFLILINSMGSSIDLLNIALIAFQVPTGSKIINNGFETFYK